MNIFDRQKNLRLAQCPRAVVVGCGGTGTWTSIFLAMSGVSELHLYDPDKLEETNLNRLPFKLSDIGKPKVDVLKDFILAIRPQCLVYAYNMGIEDSTLSILTSQWGNASVFDCTDRKAVQKLLSQKVPQRIRCGYDGGTHVTVSSTQYPEWGDEKDDPYAVHPSWVCSAALGPAMAVAKLLLGLPDKNLTADLKDLFLEV